KCPLQAPSFGIFFTPPLRRGFGYCLSLGPAMRFYGTTMPTPPQVVASAPGIPIPTKTVTYPSWFIVYEPVLRLLGPELSPLRNQFSILNPYRVYLGWWQ
ncbi:MAG: hypothetical protein O2960_29795, partial [Verrucomicrobia bacterium]|nr:hypothetical protein [Verrucomicrobiota bacterium]